MPISFGRKNRLPTAQTQSRLADLRSPEAFRNGFIPGSYSVPDLACVCAARRRGLFEGRKVYLLADGLEQLQLCSDSRTLGEGADIAGWFGPDAIEEWRKMNPQMGILEAIDSDTLPFRMTAWNTLLFDIHSDSKAEGGERPLSHPDALRFRMNDLPSALDGLPVESSLCLNAATNGLASFAASLLWNCGFHRVSYLNGGARIHLPLLG
jgi:rhodanese-related sulfurtransferase